MLLLILLLIIIAALPIWPYNKNWGFQPLAIIILTILAFIGLTLFAAAGLGVLELLIVLCLELTAVFFMFRGRGKDVQERAVFCRQCGDRMPVAQRYCGKCGAELPDLSAYRLGQVTRRIPDTDPSGLSVPAQFSAEVPSVTENTTRLIDIESAEDGSNQIG